MSDPTFEARVGRMFREQRMDTSAISIAISVPEHEVYSALHADQERHRRESAEARVRSKLKSAGLSKAAIDAELARRPGMTTWSEADYATAKDMWVAGFSASHIASKLRTKTRNAVIGIASRNRKDFPEREKATAPLRYRPKRARGNVPAVRRARAKPLLLSRPVPEAPPEPPTCRPVPLLALSDSACRFPVGEACGEQQMFCGAPASPNPEDRPYCRYHAGIAYRPDPDRKKLHRVSRLANDNFTLERPFG